jgi:ATP-dependent HslUV protease subunit HslV
VLEPDNGIATIGSGSMYANAAAIALKKHAGDKMTARQIVEEALHIAADICIYTNHNLVVEEATK